jgi:hypothetical protein
MNNRKLSNNYGKLSKVKSTKRQSNVWRRVAVVATGVFIVGVSLSACGDKKRDATQFCRQLALELPGLRAPLQSQSDVDQLIERYRRIGDVAPLSVSKDWNTLTALLQETARVDTGDVEELEELAKSAYSKNTGAQQALAWTRDTCGVDLSTG